MMNITNTCDSFHGDRYMIEAYNISKVPAIVVFNSQGWSTDLIFLLPCRFCTVYDLSRREVTLLKKKKDFIMFVLF